MQGLKEIVVPLPQILRNMHSKFNMLLRAGLWGTPVDVSLFDADTNWTELYQLAKAQTVTAILLDGIQTLPTECRPPRALYLQWCSDMLVIEEKNHKLNRELANVVELARQIGACPVLVKGQGVAQCYRVPLHRQPGDIDLYIGNEKFGQLNQCLRTEAVAEKEESYRHTTLQWHDITVENHRVLICLSSPFKNRKLQQLIKQWHSQPELLRIVNIEGSPTYMPPLEFDVAYVLLHATLHFLNEGIGMRHVCDWMCLLHAHAEQLNKPLANALLKEFGLIRAARLFGAIAVEYFGLPANELPVNYRSQDLPDARWLLDTIMHEGNFGRHDTQRKKRPKGYWRSKWYTLTRAIHRCIEMRRLAPNEAFWYPISLIFQWIIIQWKTRVKLSSSASKPY